MDQLVPQQATAQQSTEGQPHQVAIRTAHQGGSELLALTQTLARQLPQSGESKDQRGTIAQESSGMGH